MGWVDTTGATAAAQALLDLHNVDSNAHISMGWVTNVDIGNAITTHNNSLSAHSGRGWITSSTATTIANNAVTTHNNDVTSHNNSFVNLAYNVEGLLNGGFWLLQRGNITGFTPDYGKHGLDMWYSIGESGLGDMRHSRENEIGLNGQYSGKLQNNNAGTKRIALAQIIPYSTAVQYRGSIVRFQCGVQTSTSRSVRSAIIAYNGAANTFTPTLRDCVLNWTSSNYVNNDFFKSNGNGYYVVAVSDSVNCDNTGFADVIADSVSSGETGGVVPLDCNNIIVVVWDELGVPTAESMRIVQARFNFNTVTRNFVVPSFGEIVNSLLPYFEKSYDLDVAPGTASADGSIRDERRYGSSCQTINNTVTYVRKFTAPTMLFYAADGTANMVTQWNTGSSMNQSAGSFLTPYQSRFKYHYTTPCDGVEFHWTADSTI
jgi:hypothetical protein